MEPTPNGGGFPGSGILGRLGEKVIGWIAFGLLALGAYGIYSLGPEGRGAIATAAGRIAMFAATVLVLPWLTRFFIKRLLSIGENWVGLALIAGLTLIDLVVGLWLLGGLPIGFWGWLISLAIVGLMASYNYLVCEYLAETLGGM
ncbi:MAG: hypothetical protein SF069_03570 [Phycisphaerae bacterium]|nr:hypothetical protein [Phycisphaerae bacterium]